MTWQVRRGESWPSTSRQVSVLRGMARQSWHLRAGSVSTRLVAERVGKAGLGRRGTACRGESRSVKAWRGPAGAARPGSAGHVEARSGRAGLAWHCLVRRGWAVLGPVSHGGERRARRGAAGAVWLGSARPGWVRLGTAGHGRRGKACRVEFRHIAAWPGKARQAHATAAPLARSGATNRKEV